MLLSRSLGQGPELYLTVVPPDSLVLEQGCEVLTKLRKKLFVLIAWELQPADIFREKQLGSGNFGEVFKGTWKGMPCAVKMLKRGAPEEARNEFYLEANIMKWEAGVRISSDRPGTSTTLML